MEKNEIITVDSGTGEITVAAQAIELLRQNEVNIKAAKKQNDEIKAALKAAMEEYGVEKIESDVLNATYVGAHESVKLSTEEVKTKYPRIYSECSHLSPVKASVRVTLK